MGSKSSSGNAVHKGQTIPLEVTSREDDYRFPPVIEAKMHGSKEALNTYSANIGVDDGLLEPGGGPNPPTNPLPEGGAELIPTEPLPRGGQPPSPWIPPEQPPRPYTPPLFDGFHVNYSTKKTIAQGMMDLALLTANASQLRYIVHSPHWDLYHKINIWLISISIVLQIVVGISLIFIGHYDYRHQEHKRRPQLVNNISVALVFTITVINIFIATFGVDDYRPFISDRPVYRPSHVEPLVGVTEPSL